MAVVATDFTRNLDILLVWERFKKSHIFRLEGLVIAKWMEAKVLDIDKSIRVN